MRRMVVCLLIILALFIGAVWTDEDTDYTVGFSLFVFSDQHELVTTTHHYDENPVVQKIVTLPDGQVTLLVNGYHNGKHGCETTIYRFAADGTEQWTYVHDRRLEDFAVTPDGSVYVVSEAYSNNYYIFRLSPDGEIEWDLLVHDPDNRYAYATRVEVASNDDAVFAGYSFMGRDTHLMAARIDAQGNLDWTYFIKPQEEAAETLFFDVALDEDDNVLLTGYAYCYGFLFSRTYYSTVMIDAQGDTMWVKNFFILDPRLTRAEQHAAFDADGNIIQVHSVLDDERQSDLVLMKYSADGDLLWINHMIEPENQYYHSYALDADGNIYLAGEDSPMYAGQGRFRVVKFASTGELIWSTTFLPEEDERSFANHLDVNDDGEVIVAGATCADACRYAVLNYDADGNLLAQTLLAPVEPLENAEGLYAHFIDSGALVFGYAENWDIDWDDFPENDCEAPQLDDDDDDDDTFPDDDTHHPDDDTTPDDDDDDDTLGDDDTPGDNDDAANNGDDDDDDDDDDGCGC